MKLKLLHKVGSECKLNSWPDSSVGYSVWTEFSGHGFKSHPSKISMTTLKNPSVVNSICIMYQVDYFYKVSIKTNVVTGEGNRQNEIWHLTNRWNWNSCRKLALSASWTRGLIPQSVRVSERNLEVMGSKPTQSNTEWIIFLQSFSL